jgi:lipopolysaccharide/colanic/teichoic acid biosynthesis glycosyltransferase
MSLVGPRPSLFSQHDLINARTIYGVFSVRPGITGLAQLNRIDMSTPDLLAQTDAQMLSEMNIGNYFKYVYQTIAGKGRGDGVNFR